jgi:YVTN family beta-propeller protein
LRLPARLLVVALLAACAHAERVETSVSSSIVLSADESRVYVASPDDDLVSEIDATTLEETGRITVAGEPTELASTGTGLVVTLAARAAIALVDEARAVSFVDVPCGATRSVVVVDDEAFVTCPFDDRLVRVDLRARVVTAIVHVPGAPTSVARAGDLLAVGATRPGTLHLLSLAILAPLRAEAVVEVDGLERASAELESGVGFAATHVEAIAADPLGRFAVSFTRVDHDSDRARPPAEGGYGSVVDGAPRIEPRLFSPCGARYARFDGGPRASSGPSALAWRGDRLWIAHQYTDDVTLVRCASPDELADASGLVSEAQRANGEAEWLGSFTVGRAPRGIAVSADGAHAWVDLAFDHAVARLEADDVDARHPSLVRRRELGATRWSEAALRGRSEFHDAVDTHLTPSGIVTCATCHPGGQEDGLSWFLSTTGVPRKLRRTPAAWAARPSLTPFHWNGEFTDAALLSRTTIHELMGGDALLVDLDAIAAYLAEIAPPPAAPITEADAPRVELGRTVFASSGCAECHAGAMFADGLRHDVVAPSLDPDGVLASVDTPTLVGVRSRAPYLHDGRAVSLRAVLVEHNPADQHGVTSSLAEPELDALVRYLESL